MNRRKLAHNFRFLNQLFNERNIEWGVVTKLLCGNEMFLKEVLDLGVKEIHDSRISNLQKVKKLKPDVQTVYIKPPAKRSIERIIQYADVSFNTELTTIKWLSDEAVRQGKQHKIMVMIEMGDLREGVLGEDLLNFYQEVIKMPNIKVSGIGTNLNCLNGVMPTQDKLIQLSLYKQLLEAKLDVVIPYVSGGTTVSLPLILKNANPRAVNHFRVGEALFFGKDLFTEGTIEGMYDDVFTLYAEVIEVTKKPSVPIGELGKNVAGNTFQTADDEDLSGHALRAIVDIGLLDVVPQGLIPLNPEVQVIDASSDMLIVDITNSEKDYKIGDLVRFKMNYMAALFLLNSKYIDKKVEEA